jgi:hypothetical protein
MRFVLTLLACLLACHAASAQVPGTDEYAPVLVPFGGPDQAGGFGTVWRTDFLVYNASDEPIRFYGASCPAAIICPTFGEWPAASYGEVRGYMGHPGYVLWVPMAELPRVRFSLRLKEITYTNFPSVQVPIVPSDHMFSDTTDLLLPSIGFGKRAMLRVYFVPDVEDRNQRFTVSLHNKSGADLGTLQLQMLYPFSDFEWHSVFPFYAELDLLSAFSMIDEPDGTRLNVSANKTPSRFWAFVSITDNSTQSVQLVVPN